MKELLKPSEVKLDPIEERIIDDTIILNGDGKFPKDILIILQGKERRYRLVKTRNGCFILNA